MTSDDARPRWLLPLLAAALAACGSTVLREHDTSSGEDDGGAVGAGGDAACSDGGPLPCPGAAAAVTSSSATSAATGTSVESASGGTGGGSACAEDCGAAPCVDGECVSELLEQWSVTISDEKEEVQWDGVRALAADDEGGVYVATNHWIDGPPVVTEARVTRIGSHGAAAWEVTTDVETIALCHRAGRVVALANVGHPGYATAVALDPAGGQPWTADALQSPEGDQGSSVAVLDDGDALVGGARWDGALAYGPHPAITRVTAGGAIAWTRTFQASIWGHVTSLAGLPDGGYVGVIEHAGDLTLGATTWPARGERDIVLARFGADGEPVWSRPFGSEGEDGPARVAVAGDGALVLAWLSPAAIELGRVDLDGGDLWWRAIGPGSVDTLALAVDFAGNILLGGTFEDTLEIGSTVLVAEPAGAAQVFVAKLDRDGDARAARTLPFTYVDHGLCRQYAPVSITTDPLGHVFVAAGGCFQDGSAVLLLSP